MGTNTLFIFYYSTHGENTEKESLCTTCTVIKCGIIYVFLVIVHVFPPLLVPPPCHGRGA